MGDNPLYRPFFLFFAFVIYVYILSPSFSLCYFSFFLSPYFPLLNSTSPPGVGMNFFIHACGNSVDRAGMKKCRCFLFFCVPIPNPYPSIVATSLFSFFFLALCDISIGGEKTKNKAISTRQAHTECCKKKGEFRGKIIDEVCWGGDHKYFKTMTD